MITHSPCSDFETLVFALILMKFETFMTFVTPRTLLTLSIDWLSGMLLFEFWS